MVGGVSLKKILLAKIDCHKMGKSREIEFLRFIFVQENSENRSQSSLSLFLSLSNCQGSRGRNSRTLVKPNKK